MAYDLNAIYDRTSGYCHICHRKLAFYNYGIVDAKGAWEVEHSRPRALGGTHDGNNKYAIASQPGPCARETAGSERRLASRSAARQSKRRPLPVPRCSESQVTRLDLLARSLVWSSVLRLARSRILINGSSKAYSRLRFLAHPLLAADLRPRADRMEHGHLLARQGRVEATEKSRGRVWSMGAPAYAVKYFRNAKMMTPVTETYSQIGKVHRAMRVIC